MKRLSEHTNKELTQLTDQQVTDLIDLECAHEGLALLPPDPGPEPVSEIPRPTETFYKLFNIYVADREHVTRLEEALLSGQLYKTTYPTNDYSTRGTALRELNQNDYSFPKVETQKLFLEKDFPKEQIRAHHKAKKAWQVLNKAYTEAKEARSEVEKRVNDAIQSAITDAHNRIVVTNNFATYLRLADGNEQVAMRFLERTTDLTVFPGLKEDLLATARENKQKGETQ